MKRLSMTAAVLALAAAAPARAASPARGLALRRAIYADAADAPLRRPEGVACDPGGAVVVADTGNARLLTYTWKDGALDGGTPVKLAQLAYPVRVQIDRKGFVLALDRRSRRIVRVDARGAFAGFLEPKGAGQVTVSAFKLDASDAAVVLDAVAGRVLVIAPDGKITRELPLPKGAAGPADVAVDRDGRIYLLDAVTATIFAAEKGATAFRPLGKGLGDAVSFPAYLAVDGRGRIWVVDVNGGALVAVGSDGGIQSRELSFGWSEGSVRYPGQLCVTAAGDVVIADRDNDRVQVFSPPR